MIVNLVEQRSTLKQVLTKTPLADAEDDASPQRILNVSQFLAFGFLNIHHTPLFLLEIR